MSALTTAAQRTFLDDVVAGLGAAPKSLPCKYLYDAAGSQLFDQICELEEYYPTRTEIGILEECVDELCTLIAGDAVLIEPGAGNGQKTRMLLDQLPSISTYVPVDISGDYLGDAAARLADEYAGVDVVPVAGDFTETVELPESVLSHASRLVFFPGSTIGNFTPDDAVNLLSHFREMAGAEGRLLIGADLVKPAHVLEAAYDDAEGITAAFNLNLLTRINAELDGNFVLDQFSHRAVYNAAFERVEMHLVSQCRQTVHVADETFRFHRGEMIHTENSHKYTPASFMQLARGGGWDIAKAWTDPRRLFSVWLLAPAV